MLFFKIDTTLESDCPRLSDPKTDERARVKISEYSRLHSEDVCYFISDIRKTSLTMGAIVSSACPDWSGLPSLFEYAGLKAKDVTVSELTREGIVELLRRNFEERDAITQRFKLLGDRALPRIEVSESLMTETSKENIYRSAAAQPFGGSLIPELDRIYSAGRASKAYGHPVHYIVRSDDRGASAAVSSILLQALYANGRLASRRINTLSGLAAGTANVSADAYCSLYGMCSDGAVVISVPGSGARRLTSGAQRGDLKAGDPGAGAFADTANLEKICDAARKYRNRVLTVFCLPMKCGNAMSVLREKLADMPMVMISEDRYSRENAEAVLKKLCKDAGLRADKKLFASLEENKSYGMSDLRDVFDGWLGGKLTVRVYPQYRDISAAWLKETGARPKVSAYDELQELIGLGSVKQTIQDILDYSEWQKIRAGGAVRNSQAMHMCFTGNPGTAKTTVARLIAEILKERGILSKGHLIETGRADLVARYVGWTAQNVKEKFIEAAGGVLFIDEAYSLVDSIFSNHSYGEEAINTIVQEMENARGETVVIFAGYPDKMETFLRRNPGLRSRIKYHIRFEDYSPRELCEITGFLAEKRGYRISGGAEDKLMSLFETAVQLPDFGNGRFARNILEQAITAQGCRLLREGPGSVTDAAAASIEAADIRIPELDVPVKRRIGF